MEQVEGCYGCRMLARRVADAQATIAALQEERDGWVRSREHYYQLWMRATDERDEMRKERDEFESLLTQRTAELEAATRRATNAQWQVDFLLGEAKKAFGLTDEYTPADLVDCVLRPAASMLKERDALKAELERVSLLSSHNERRFEMLEEKYKDLRTLILALPKVEGEIVAQAGYVKDRKKVYVCFGSDADMTAYAALLTHRQGMEG